MEQIKLTQFSPGAGCGCKISPADLEDILKSEIAYSPSKNLLVGNDSKDDAAVYDIGNGQAIISTTDFFTPIVDDAFDFGRIAATNALSDVYAMGGKPIMAIAVLGWPLQKLSKDVARKVIEGARSVCDKAEITLAGGHSIDIADPVFGLAVTGVIQSEKVKQNSTATADCSLFLTKPLGVGVLTTAEKKGIVRQQDLAEAVAVMTILNSVGGVFSDLDYVTAMTDVTGFGLLGHLLEICESSSVAAEIDFNAISLLPNVVEYVTQQAIPGGTFRNWRSYGAKVQDMPDDIKHVLCDPQTSGGLLVAVNNSNTDDFIKVCKQQNLNLKPIGKLQHYDGSGVYVKVV